jgi:2-polyprenyl-6-methoxyphenol hydroxylase-like FAD-dependent oxidoreductase
MSKSKALIAGGSLGGLFAATLLRNAGWDVLVYERARGDLSGRGVGLGTRDELFAILRQAGATIENSIEAAVRSRIFLDRNGEVGCELPIATVTTAWDRVYRALKSALPAELYRSGKSLESFDQAGGKVMAFFADGSSEEADLLVGADGMNSTVRRRFLPDVEPQYAGYVAWRGAVTEMEVPSAYREGIFHHMNFCFPDGELAVTVPMPPSDDGGHSSMRSQFSWFRPVDRATELPLLCTDANGHCHGESIPPPAIRQDLLSELRADAEMKLAPQVATMVARTPQIVLQPIYDLESPRLVFGNVVLLGDAAFVARPHVGTGVTKAALDAQCLAEVLHKGDNVSEALHRYDVERRRFGSWLVARGRYLGAYLSAQHKPREQRRGRELDRNPEVFMREFGGAGVLAHEPPDASRWS